MNETTSPAPHGMSPSRRSQELVSAKGKILAVVFGIGILMLLGGMAYYAFRSGTNDREQAILAAQQMITRAKLPSGVTAKFNPPEWTHFETLPDGKYYLSGWLQVITPFGSATSYTYTCKLSMNDSRDWVFDSLDLLPQ